MATKNRGHGAHFDPPPMPPWPMEKTHPPPVPKRIIICCDGTWQSAVSGRENSPSNITRLARLLEPAAIDMFDKVWQQIVWYDSGVGTTSSTLGRVLEGAVGDGLEGNVIEAYNFVALNYNPGDQVMCFGFSRGAYTARTIAGLISDIGICEPKYLNNFHKLWKVYKTMIPGNRFYGSDEYYALLDGVPAGKEADSATGEAYLCKSTPIRGSVDWQVDPSTRDIEVVGVYDTVGSLGFPSVRGWHLGSEGAKFHNVQLNRNIKHAYHALAMDEHREAFTPTLWSLPDDLEPASEDQIKEQTKVIESAKAAFDLLAESEGDVDTKQIKEAWKQYAKARRDMVQLQESLLRGPELLQVWFPGVHINCGGGANDTLKHKGDLEEISTITFNWMLEQIRPYVGIRGQDALMEGVARCEYAHKLDGMAKAYKQKLLNEKKAHEKESYWAWTTRLAGTVAGTVTKTILHPFTGTEVPDLRRHTYGWGTGAYIDSYTTMYVLNGSKPRTPGAYSKDAKEKIVGRTNEYVHPSVGYRMAKTAKLPDAEKYLPLGKNKEGKPRVVRQTKEGYGFEYIIDGIPLQESIINPDFTWNGEYSFERGAISGVEANRYIQALDSAYGFPDQGYPFEFMEANERAQNKDWEGSLTSADEEAVQKAFSAFSERVEVPAL